MCVLGLSTRSIPLPLLLLEAFSSIFSFSQAFSVLNPEYSGLLGIISILFKNSKPNSEFRIEKITALAMIDNGRTDRRASFFCHSRFFKTFVLNKTNIWQIFIL